MHHNFSRGAILLTISTLASSPAMSQSLGLGGYEMGDPNFLAYSSGAGYFHVGDVVAPHLLVLPGEDFEEINHSLQGWYIDHTELARINDLMGRPTFLEWNFAMGAAKGRSDINQTLDGVSSIGFFSETVPDATITVETSESGGTVSGTVDIDFTDASGDNNTTMITSSSPPGPNSTSILTSTTTAEGVLVAGVDTNGATGESASFVAVSDETGFLFEATGDLGEAITDSVVKSELSYVESSFAISVLDRDRGNWDLTYSAGPTVRHTSLSQTSETNVDLAEAPSATADIPVFSFANDTHLSTNYAGVSFGASATTELQENLSFTLGGDLGLSAYKSRFSGATFNNLTPDETFTYTSTTKTGTAVTAGVNAELTYVTERNFFWTVGVNVEFLSDFPTLSRQLTNGAVVTDTADGVSIDSSGTQLTSSPIETDSIVTTNAYIGVTFPF